MKQRLQHLSATLLFLLILLEGYWTGTILPIEGTCKSITLYGNMSSPLVAREGALETSVNCTLISAAKLRFYSAERPLRLPGERGNEVSPGLARNTL